MKINGFIDRNKNRFFVILMVFSLTFLFFGFSQRGIGGNHDVCYKYTTDFWGQHKIQIDCTSQNVDVRESQNDFNIIEIKSFGFYIALLLSLVVGIFIIKWTKKGAFI